jgi:hypothetical protein
MLGRDHRSSWVPPCRGSSAEPTRRRGRTCVSAGPHEPEYVALLDKIGFLWTLAQDRRAAGWNTRYDELRHCLRAEGHLNVPRGPTAELAVPTAPAAQARQAAARQPVSRWERGSRVSIWRRVTARSCSDLATELVSERSAVFDSVQLRAENAPPAANRPATSGKNACNHGDTHHLPCLACRQTPHPIVAQPRRFPCARMRSVYSRPCRWSTSCARPVSAGRCGVRRVRAADELSCPACTGQA